MQSGDSHGKHAVMKILPLQESINRLRQLGEFAATEQLCTIRDIAGENTDVD